MSIAKDHAYMYQCHMVAFEERYREAQQLSLKELLSHFPDVLDLGYVEEEKKQVAMSIIAQKNRGLSMKQINFLRRVWAECMADDDLLCRLWAECMADDD